MIQRRLTVWEITAVGAVFLTGLVLKLRLAIPAYLNPDEVWHSFLAFEPWRRGFRESLREAHPPLVTMVLHTVALFSHGDLAMRMLSIVTGSLFPVVIYFWLYRCAGRMAAFAALFLLTMSPNVIAISAQVRSYAPALFFLALALFTLEIALERDNWPLMIVYGIFLLLCIFSDYSMAWFAGAAGGYALLRLRGSSVQMKAVWAAGQVAALAAYAYLFRAQVNAYRGSKDQAAAVYGWLRDAFPHSGNMFRFPFSNTLGQFTFLMGSKPMGAIALLAFAAAIILLWTGRSVIERGRARALAVFVTLPFVLGIAGAYAHFFPYGATRHTVVLGMFAAIGVAIVLESVPPIFAVIFLCATLAPIPGWGARPSAENMAADRNQKSQFLECVAYLKSAIPPGTVIFAERETLEALAYYDGQDAQPPWPPPGRFSDSQLAGKWRMAARDYMYSTFEEYRDGLLAFRRQYGFAPEDPIWVLDGGWVIVTGPPDETRPFTRVMRIFQAGPDGRPISFSQSRPEQR